MGYIEDIFNLKGKVVAVTGGGGFLCGEMARAFGRSGCKVIVLDIRLDKAQEVAEEIIVEGGEAYWHEHDAIKKESFEECLNFTLEKFGRCDVLVNGAGVNAPTPVLEITEEEFDSIMDSHLKGTLFGCQVFGKHMLERGSGSIMNMSSASAGPPLSKAFTYSAAKAGIKNITQNIAREWATKGVRVNALRPGFFPTQWSKEKFITKERESAILGHTAMKRYGEPKELIGATLWLASDAAGFVTGAEIAVDGGFSCMTI